MDFVPTRFDNDIWIRLDKTATCYEYMCTHIDDFMIVSKNPEKIMKEIEKVFKVKDDSKGPPDYYLGNDYKRDSQDRLCIGCQKYLKEALVRVESIMGIKLLKRNRPIEVGDHPEEDESKV